MAVKEVKSYQCSDGALFNEEYKANSHEAERDLHGLLRDNGPLESVEDALEFIWENKPLILKYLEAMHGTTTD